MAYDFRTEGMRATRIIASGSQTKNIGLLVYSSSAASDMEGGQGSGITSRLSSVGEDVWLYIDGVPSNDPRFKNTRDVKDGNRVVLFNGDVVISGTLYASTQVVQADESVEGDLLVPNDLFVTGAAVFNNGKSSTGDFIVRSSQRSHAIFVDSDRDSIGIGFGLEEVSDALSGQPALSGTLHIGEANAAAIVVIENQSLSGSKHDAQITFKHAGDPTFSLGADESASLAFDLVYGDVLGRNSLMTIRTGTYYADGDAEIVFNENSGDHDFRIEGNNTANLFSLDAGDDTVTIEGASGGSNDTFTVKTYDGSSVASGLLVGMPGSSAEVVINEDAGDIDFRVETSNQPRAIWVNAGDDSITLTANQGAATAIDINAVETGSGIDIDAGSGGIAMDTSSGGAITVNATAAQLQIKTTTSGEVDVTSAGAVDINAAAGIDIDDTGTGGNGGVTIDTTDTTNGITIGAGVSGVPVTIGHTTSEVTIADNLTVTGDLHVDGDTVYTNVATMTVQDPIFDIGGGVDGAAPSGDDNKDRGVSFQWHNGATAKQGFFGYDDSQAVWTFVPDATISSEIVSGNPGTVRVRRVELYDDGDEAIYSDGTDIHIDVGSGGDINIGASVGLTFGADTQKIEADSDNNLEIDAAGSITLDAEGDVILDANGANVTLKDGGTTVLDFVANGATDVTLDAPGDIILDVDGGDVKFDRGGATRLRFDISTGVSYIQNGTDGTDIAFRVDAGATEIARFDDSAGSFLMATDKPIQFRDTLTAISSSATGKMDVYARTNLLLSASTLDLRSHTVEVKGDLNVSGTLTPASLSLSNLDLSSNGYIRFGDTNNYIQRSGNDLQFRDNSTGDVKTLADLATVTGIGPFEALSNDGVSPATLKIRTTGSFSLDADNQYAEQHGDDIFMYVSSSFGTNWVSGGDNRKVPVFGGDLLVSGNVSLGMTTIQGQMPYVSGDAILAISGSGDRPMALISGSLRMQSANYDYIGEITPGYNHVQSEVEQDIYFRNIRSSGRIIIQAGGNSSSNVVGEWRGDQQSLRMLSGKKIEFAGASRYIDSSATTSINYVNSNAGGNHTFTGNIVPVTNNTYNLGSDSLRFANIYTGDLNLKNDRGDWTILEEEDYLCVINNKTGKKFKMMLEPIEESE